MDFLKIFDQSNVFNETEFQIKCFFLSLACLGQSVHDKTTGHVDEYEY